MRKPLHPVPFVQIGTDDDQLHVVGTVREGQLADDRPHQPQHLLAIPDQRVPGFDQHRDHLGQVVDHALIAPEFLQRLAGHRLQLDVGRHVLRLTPGHLGTRHSDADPDDPEVEVLAVRFAFPHPLRPDGSRKGVGSRVEPPVVGVHAVGRLLSGFAQHVQHQHELGAHGVQLRPAHLLLSRRRRRGTSSSSSRRP